MPKNTKQQEVWGHMTTVIERLSHQSSFLTIWNSPPWHGSSTCNCQKKTHKQKSNLRSGQNSLGWLLVITSGPFIFTQQFGKNVRIFRHLDGPSLIPEGHLISHPVIPISNNKIITWDANPDRSLMAEFRKTHPPTFRLSDGKVNRPTLPPGTLWSIVAGIVFRR